MVGQVDRGGAVRVVADQGDAAVGRAALDREDARQQHPGVTERGDLRSTGLTQDTRSDRPAHGDVAGLPRQLDVVAGDAGADHDRAGPDEAADRSQRDQVRLLRGLGDRLQPDVGLRVVPDRQRAEPVPEVAGERLGPPRQADRLLAAACGVLQEGLGDLEGDLVAPGGDVPVVEVPACTVELVRVAAHARAEDRTDRGGPVRVDAGLGVGRQRTGDAQGVDHPTHGAARGLGQGLFELLGLAQGLLPRAGGGLGGMLGDLVLVVRDVAAGPEHEEALARGRPRAGAAPHDRGRGEHLEGEVGRVGAPGLLEEVVIGGLDVRALLEGECIVDQLAALLGGVDTPERRLPEPGAVVVADLQGRAEAALEPDDVRGGVAHVIGQVGDPAVDVDPEHHRVRVLLAGVADEADLASRDIRPILPIAPLDLEQPVGHAEVVELTPQLRGMSGVVVVGGVERADHGLAPSHGGTGGSGRAVRDEVYRGMLSTREATHLRRTVG